MDSPCGTRHDLSSDQALWSGGCVNPAWSGNLLRGSPHQAIERCLRRRGGGIHDCGQLLVAVARWEARGAMVGSRG
jgi:hypothetical protein